MQLQNASVNGRAFAIGLFRLQVIQCSLGINSENNYSDNCNN